jgi:hypothetical protein
MQFSHTATRARRAGSLLLAASAVMALSANPALRLKRRPRDH